jgi:uncharacterized protein (DUF305 family)
MKNTTKALAVLIGIAVVGGFAYTKLPGANHVMMARMNHGTAAAADTGESTKAFETAMSGMMQGMMTPRTGKPDLDFAQGMIPHHQGAIDMAKIVLQFGKDAEVRKLAEAVVKAQEGEIMFMKDWVAKVDQAALVASPESDAANGTAMATMMEDMMLPYTGNADVDFIKGMIPHHQGAIDMAKVELNFGKDPALLKLARDVVNAQTGEIAFMTNWLQHNK